MRRCGRRAATRRASRTAWPRGRTAPSSSRSAACAEIKFTVHLHAIDATRAHCLICTQAAGALAATILTHYSAAALPLFAAAAAYAARRLRAQHASSLGDAFARQDGRAGAGADAAAFASYAAAAAHASSLRRHRAAAGWGVVLCAAPVLLFLRVPRKEGRRLPSLVSSGPYERRHVTAAVNFLRGAAWVLAPTSWLALTALGRGGALLPLVLALAGPGAVAAAAARARHVVAAALVSWPLTLAPFFLRGAGGDGLLLGALGCVGSAGVALFYEEPRGGWED